MHRVWIAALLASAAAVFVTAAYVLVHTDRPPSGAASIADLGTSAASLPTSSAPTTSTTTATSTTTTAKRHPVVAFLGDDWTSGVGASSRAKRFTTIVSEQLGLTERNFGAPGSGYAKSRPRAGTYRSRVSDVVAAHPDVVVVSGGRNDITDFAPTAATAADRLFATLHDLLPDATLVAIAPFWGDSDLPPEMAALSKAVEKAVTDVGGHYLDLADPIHGHPEYMADEADPNNEGYAAIAAAVGPSIQALLPSD